MKLIYEPVNQNDMPPKGTKLFFGGNLINFYCNWKWYYYNQDGNKVFIEMRYIGFDNEN